MNKTVRQVFALLAAAALTTSCMDELAIDGQNKGKLEEVYFTASIAEQDFLGMQRAMTRSAADERERVKAGFYDLAFEENSDLILNVSTLDGMFGKPSPLPVEGQDNGATRSAMIEELGQKPMKVYEICKTSDGSIVSGEPYDAYTEDGSVWGGSHVQHNDKTVARTIHAIYPKCKEAVFEPEKGTISYVTPDDAEDQSDLLFASAEQSLGSSDKNEVHLTFKHLLTAVRFKVGPQQLPMSRIINIVIEGISSGGVYDMKTGNWTISDTRGMCSCPLNYDITGLENTIINGGDYTFMLLPQKLTPDAKVTIIFEDLLDPEHPITGHKSLTARLATATTPAWEAGQCVTYTLMDHESKSDYHLDVEAPQDYTTQGGTQVVNVTSYREQDGVRYPVRWMVQGYSSDGGHSWMSGANNVPAGMSVFPTDGQDKEVTPIMVSVLAADSVCLPHSQFMRNRPALGYDAPFDLSKHDYLNNSCRQTTANCYVVDAPGKYRFPTAYGNAIVNGKTNKEAYTDKANYKHAGGSNFMTHNGKPITAPMIQNNGINLTRATLIWEDAKNLIDPASIKLVDNGNAIEFEILPENIDLGNAVIAAMDGNTVAWSWHIWVTDEKSRMAEPIADKNKYGEAVNFMPVNLGWCSTSYAYGAIGRDAAVRITQPSHLTSRASFRIHQETSLAEDGQNNTEGSSPYYNWGRKDPFPGVASNAEPTVVNESAMAQPKPFYQAGADAATYGLHGELHVTYGSNIGSLLVEGAAVGLDGFMTGVTIGNVINYFHSKAAYKAASEKFIDGLQCDIDVTADPLKKTVLRPDARTMKEYGKYTYDMDDLVKDATLKRSSEVNRVSNKFQSMLQDGYKPERFTHTDLGEGLLWKNKKGTPSFWTQIEKKQFTQSAANYTYFNVCTYNINAHLSVAPRLFLGNFAAVMLANTGQVICNNFNVMKAFGQASIFKGGTDWCREMKTHGVSVAYGIQNPHVLMRDPISWVNHDGFGNLWNAAQTTYDDMNESTVKSIFDPSPAGYCVPSARDMSQFTDASTKTETYGSTSKTTDAGAKLMFPGLGCRNFWSGTEPGAAANNNINDQILFNGDQGLYWTSSPAINQNEDGEKGAYAVNFRGGDTYDYYGEKEGYKYTPRVVNNLKLQPSYALPIRPVRER